MEPTPLSPAPGLRGIEAYVVPRHPAPVDLRLDGNEGPPPDAALFDALLALGPELLRRYAKPSALEAQLAERHGVAPERVLVGAGADEALDRLCRATLAPGRELVLPVPTFVMIPHYAQLAGATVQAIDWSSGPYPLAEVLAAIGPETTLAAVVSPNNPTGAEATRADLVAVANALPHGLVIADYAYAEFADEDPTAHAAALPNVVVFRTLSKARGLAGLRIGYAIGPPQVIAWMRAAGGPYPVSSVSLALASAALHAGDEAMQAYVGRVKQERARLATLLAELGAEVSPSAGNFVFPRFRDEVWVHDALAGLGIGVRRFPGADHFAGALRITCPGDAHDFERLAHGLRCALAPEALILDLASDPVVPELGLPSAVRAGASLPAVLADLGTRRAWTVADTPDGLRSARAAATVPLALAPAEATDEHLARLYAAGAARVLFDLAQLEPLLP